MNKKFEVSDNLINSLDSIFGLMTTVLSSSILPLSISLLGVRLMNRILYKEKYEELNVLVQNRLFLNYMPNDLLNNTLFILQKEKHKRFKLKVNNFLKFRLFKNYD